VCVCVWKSDFFAKRISLFLYCISIVFTTKIIYFSATSYYIFIFIIIITIYHHLFLP
jgi:hypothetical protein